MLKFKNKKLLLLMTLMLVGIMLFTACASKEKSEEISENTGGTQETSEKVVWTVVIETPDNKNLDFTNLDLEQIGKINMKATTKKKDGTEEENEWTGVKLKDILGFANIDEYKEIEIEAGDGFSVEYTKEIANSDKTILAVEKDGQALDEKSAPAQMVVEGEGAKLWVKNVAKIKVSN